MVDLETLLKQFGKNNTIEEKQENYSKLIEFLYNCGNLVEQDVNKLVDELDKLFDEYLADEIRTKLREQSKNDKISIYTLEVGVLLDKNNEEFDCYTISDFYDDKWGFYDENRIAFFDENKARRYANDYVVKGVDRTYAVLHYEERNLDDIEDKEIVSIECNGYMEYYYNPNKDNTLLFIHKDKEEKIETEIYN